MPEGLTVFNKSQNQQARYRAGNVGMTNQAVAWIRDEFGIDMDLLGRLTPDEVRRLSLQSQEMEQQLKLVKVAYQAIEKITTLKSQIEEFRAEAITSSLARKTEIDKIVSKLEVKVAEHAAHIQKITQETGQQVMLTQRRASSDMELSRTKFQNNLRAIAEKGRRTLRDEAESHSAYVRGLDQQAIDASAKSVKDKQFNDYISGRGSRQPVAAGGWGSWFN